MRTQMGVGVGCFRKRVSGSEREWGHGKRYLRFYYAEGILIIIHIFLYLKNILYYKHYL